MEATDPIIRIEMARSDAAFIHDVLMSCEFRGAQMLQASGIIAGLRPALSAKPVAAPAPEAVESPPDDVFPDPAFPSGSTQTLELRALPSKKKRPAKRKR